MSTWTVAAHELRAEQARILANVLLEMDPDEIPTDGKRVIASPAGSEARLRGIPVVGARGVGGTIKGTNPIAALIAKDRRQPAAYRPDPTSLARSPRRALRNVLIQRDGPACYLCGETPDINHLDIEHIIPISRGGERDDPTNLALACTDCNMRKGTHYVSLDITSGAPRYHRSE